MKTVLISIALLLIIAACATTTDKNAALRNGINTVNAYVEVTKTQALRGRITPDQGDARIVKAEKARDTLRKAQAALACQEKAATGVLCGDPDALLTSIRPLLLEYERELQGAKP